LNNQIKEDEMGWACKTNKEKINAYRLLLGRPERKRPLGGPRCVWVHNIKMNFRELGWGGNYWIDLVQYWSVLFHEILGNSQVTAQVAAS
jgi:hypothetical protein